MKIASLAVPASMNVLLKQYPKVIFIRLIPMFAQIVVPVQMFVR